MKKVVCSLSIVLLLLSMVFISCKKDKEEETVKNKCDVSNPVEDLDWLKNSIDEIKQSNDDVSKHAYYMTATYKGETVFYYMNCHPAIDYVSFLQKCNGDTIGNTFNFYDDLTDKKILWQHEQSECNFTD